MVGPPQAGTGLAALVSRGGRIMEAVAPLPSRVTRVATRLFSFNAGLVALAALLLPFFVRVPLAFPATLAFDLALGAALLLGGRHFIARGGAWGSGLLVGAASLLLGVAYIPVLPLLYLPVLLRARLPLLWTTLASLLAYVGLSFAWLLALEATQVTWFTLSNVENRAGTLALLVALGGFLVLPVSAYVLALFEFALREARAYDEVEAKQRELEGALERVRALGELEALHASLTERARISRELHDTLGHHLTAQRYDLHLALRSVPGDTEAREALERALTRNEDAIADVRLAVNVMKPRPSGEGLLVSLRRLVSAWPDKANICLEVVGRERPLSEDVHLALYRAAQECMTNARRHAPGERLTLAVTFREDAVVLEARNPVGTRVLAHANDAGQGLASLARRAEALRGEAHSGVQGSQFVVRLRVPA